MTRFVGTIKREILYFTPVVSCVDHSLRLHGARGATCKQTKEAFSGVKEPGVSESLQKNEAQDSLMLRHEQLGLPVNQFKCRLFNTIILL